MDPTEQTRPDPDLEIHIVDDDAAIRDALRSALTGLAVRVTAHEGLAAMAASVRPHAHGCALIDMRMPGADGLETLRWLRGAHPGLHAIMLTGHADVETVIACLREGAADFIEKPWDGAMLRASVRRALELAAPECAAARTRRMAMRRLSALTPREQEVMRELVTGAANKVVARRLGLSPRTVEFHRRRVLEKTGVNSIAELVQLEAAAGVLPASPIIARPRLVDGRALPSASSAAPQRLESAPGRRGRARS